MAAQAIKLRISTPTEPIPPGRGFYQLEEDSLYVQIGLFSMDRRFFSYLESTNTRLDFDREGRLIFIEVDLPRRQWPLDHRLTRPVVAEAADIRWLDFRRAISDPSLAANTNRTTLALRFDAAAPTQNYYLSESVILQANNRHELCAILIDDIADDLAGHEIAAFRKDCRADAFHSC